MLPSARLSLSVERFLEPSMTVLTCARTACARTVGLLAVGLLVVGGVVGCSKAVEPPFDEGVCYTVSFDKNDKPSYHKLAAGVATLEACEGGLEALRLKFLAMGGTHEETTGSYQGRFIFVQKEGLFTAENLDGPRYLSLVRLGDGHLGPPGSARQSP